MDGTRLLILPYRAGAAGHRRGPDPAGFCCGGHVDGGGPHHQGRVFQDRRHFNRTRRPDERGGGHRRQNERHTAKG